MPLFLGNLDIVWNIIFPPEIIIKDAQTNRWGYKIINETHIFGPFVNPCAHSTTPVEGLPGAVEKIKMVDHKCNADFSGHLATLLRDVPSPNLMKLDKKDSA